MLYLPKETLENLYLEQKLSDSQIGKMYDVSLGRIHRLRNKYNIKAIEYYERHSKQILDQKEKEFLVGTLLGDAHLRWRNKNSKSYPGLMLEQSTKHVEYAVWLKQQIKNWMLDPEKEFKQTRKIQKRTGKIYHSYPFASICHPVFIEFYNGFYQNNKKIIDIEFITKYFTEFSLATWIMDDGTISKNRNMILCSHSFSKHENELLSEFLKMKFDLSPNIWVLKKNSFYLGFSKEDSIKLTSLVSDLIIPSMKHKLISSETTKEIKHLVL